MNRVMNHSVVEIEGLEGNEWKGVVFFRRQIAAVQAFF